MLRWKVNVRKAGSRENVFLVENDFIPTNEDSSRVIGPAFVNDISPVRSVCVKVN